MVETVDSHDGRDFVVIMPRQAGKNELSCRFEAYSLTKYARSGGLMIKSAPTFRPQLVVSTRRLRAALQVPLTEHL